jgi:hypothetical protein
MGQDRENGKDDHHPHLTVEPGPRRPAPGAETSTVETSPADFRREVRVAVRYERGLAIKAAVVLIVVAIIVILRTLYFA